MSVQSPTRPPEATPMPQEPIAPTVALLEAMGYAPKTLLADAALRLNGSPELLQDLRDYVEGGQPPADYGAGTPPSLFRPLPSGHTVGALMRDLELQPVGAFLLAVGLVQAPDEALALIGNVIAEGYWKRLPDGSIVHGELAIAQQYPACPNCALRWTRQYDRCPRCGHDEAQEAVDEEHALVTDLRRSLTPSPPAGAAQVCPVCGAAVVSGWAFCGQCQARLTPQAPAASGLVCRECGAPLQVGWQFCGRCRAPVVAPGS